MGLITNLVTANPDRWPGALRPAASYAPALGLGLVVMVGVRALWTVWRAGVPRPTWVGGNPYPGLTAYARDRAAVFFGRTGEIQQLAVRVREAHPVTGRFVPVVGPSGSGKSSLVLAGLLAAVGEGSAVAAVGPFTPGSNALGELGHVLGMDVTGPAARALSASRAGAPAPRLPEVVRLLTERRAGHRRLLVVVDQLEEAVVQCVEEDRLGFLALLEALLGQEPRLCVVATVRSDSLGGFQQGPGSDLFRDPLMVNVLGPRELRLVVTGPAVLTGTTFDDGLVDEIVRDTGGGDALPLLSYVLADLYHEAAGDHHITWSEYRASGGVPGAIARRAEAAVREIGPDELDRCLDTLLEFVTLGLGEPTRQRVPAERLTAGQHTVVQAFLRARLLTSDRVDGGHVVYDIAHEALLRQWQPLRDHIALNEDRLRRLTELTPLARAWIRSGRRPGYLIAGERLAEALAFAREQPGLAADVAEFLDASERDQAGEMERRADRAARAALRAVASPEEAVALALAAYTELAPTPLAARALQACLATGLVYACQFDGPVRSVAFAADGALAAAARDAVEIWDRDVVVRRWGERDGPVAVAWHDGRLAVAEDRAVWVWHGGDENPDVLLHAIPGPKALAYAPGGDLAVGSRDGLVRVFGPTGDEVAELTGGAGPVYALGYAAGGALAAAHADGSVQVWDAGRRPVHRLPGHGDCAFAVAFTVDGHLVSGGRDGSVRIWDRDGRLVRSMAEHPLAVNAVAVAPDGTLATGSSDGTVRVYGPEGGLRHVLTDHSDSVTALAFAADGRLATGSADGTVRVWDIPGRLIRDLGDDGVSALAFTVDGQLVTGSTASTVRFWDRDGSPVRSVDCGGDKVRALSASAHGQVAICYADGRVDTIGADGARTRWDGPDVTMLAFAPDGRLYTVRADGGIDVRVPVGAVEQAAPGAANLVAIAVRSDGAVVCLDTAGRCETRTASGEPTGEVYLPEATALALTPDGGMVTATPVGLRVAAADGEELYTIPGPAEVTAVAVAADGRLAASFGGHVRVWPPPLAPDELLRIARRVRRPPLPDGQREAYLLRPLAGEG